MGGRPAPERSERPQGGADLRPSRSHSGAVLDAEPLGYRPAWRMGGPRARPRAMFANFGAIRGRLSTSTASSPGVLCRSVSPPGARRPFGLRPAFIRRTKWR